MSNHPTVDNLRDQFEQEFSKIQLLSELETLKVKYLGKKGPVQDLMKTLKEVKPEDRPAFGQKVNQLKAEFETKCAELEEKLIHKEEEENLLKEKIDISLPGRRRYLGSKHILNACLDEIIDILISMGFSVQYGPDIESDYYNFEALNFAPDHPARDLQDTFYIAPKMLLRTHTTNIQVRVMESNQPPIRIISPGKAYRNEAISARSHVFFHQIDPLYIDKGVTFSDLLSTLDQFLDKLFYKNVEKRYRPSYFPFVEPGMEADVRCFLCEGKGCSICKYSGWLEVLGAGMVHPEVLKNGGIDPEVYSGFAWGMGLERLVMIKYGIRDIRYFTENHMRFLRQFVSL
ncbi:Phenylalanine--tRNA ligase alpha subunit [Chlamydiales bacterium STE3]|nr:Phenylalanine--tRNA ligase alpha subunit [Chlamydiales bacterium STE3]